MATRAEQNESMRAKERIGYCEICGRIDHHLVDGTCPVCRPRVRTLNLETAVDRSVETYRMES